MKTILFSTVGGSHEPLLEAIRSRDPDQVVFFCTGNDPLTGKRGSRELIEGDGKVIRIEGHTAPSLPSIPVQAGLDRDRWKVVEVPADDLEACIAIMLEELDRPIPVDVNRIADYTGGTKTMSAALVHAALHSENITLQLVSGDRRDLRKVVAQTERTNDVSVRRVWSRRLVDIAEAAWRRRAYGEAAIVLTNTHADSVDARRMLSLSRGFAHWDRFDHAKAQHILDSFGGLRTPHMPIFISALKDLNGDKPDRREGRRLWDLWLNAQRRAEAERYDDAVARCYRLLEWTAQWLLRRHCGIDTGNLQPGDLPAGHTPAPVSDGRIAVGLFQAWLVLEEKLPRHRAAQFFRGQRNQLKQQLELRNHSILAHGSEPVTKDHWHDWYRWIEKELTPILKDELASVGISRVCPQLPTEFRGLQETG